MGTAVQKLIGNCTSSRQLRGIYSVCSAHPWVLQAAVQQALADESPLLIEATSNQVNQLGGYTGMKPADFRQFVHEIARKEGLPLDRLILGGDHLGPNPWQHLFVEEAMLLAEEMVKEYARAGFMKLHLDASMACAGETVPLPDAIVAERAARLCSAAEAARGEALPLYIIGTEVPIPGGATESLEGLAVTHRKAAEETLQIHKEIFAAHGLADAWERVIGMVVQPGVEFNHDTVVDYVPEKARDLSAMLEGKSIVFEAHSTDYQKPAAYRQLVSTGFAILKVGPALTFAMREVLYALAAIERQLVPEGRRSNLPEVVEEVMLREPKNWAHHYHGSPEEQRLLRTFSYSDRVRYYWNYPEIEAAVKTLMQNLSATRIPETLLSAYLPDQYRQYREGQISAKPEDLVLYGIRQVLVPYAMACVAS